MTSFVPYREHKATTIDLVGGLGNQLFGYVAGTYLDQVCGHNVVFNTWHIPRGLTNHGVSIEGRQLPGEFRSIPRTSKWKSRLQRNFQSPELGWTPKLDNQSRGTHVEGYFQTWKYFSALRPGTVMRDNLVRGGRLLLGYESILRTLNK